MLPSDTLSLLMALLRKVIGSSVEIEHIQIANQAADYWVLLVSLRQPSLEVVIKLAGSNAAYPGKFDRNAVLYRLLASQTSIPVPEVLGVDVSQREWPWRYLIQTLIPGEQWARVRPQLSGSALIDAYRQIGQAVAELHRITFPTFGEFSNDGTVQITQDFFSALIARTRQRIQIPRLRDIALHLLDQNQQLFAGIDQPCLCHEDLHHYNILFRQDADRWQLATILDFDKAWAGHYEIDLARLELWTNMIGQGFWDNYPPPD
jgi:aminoglycoside phosphotransferase (APT) family kinase protein